MKFPISPHMQQVPFPPLSEVLMPKALRHLQELSID